MRIRTAFFISFIIVTMSSSAEHPLELGADGRHQIRVGVRLGFNVSANFRDSQPVDLLRQSRRTSDSKINQLSLQSHQENHPGGGDLSAGQYDDGFVGTDISGNAGDLTWNWGYESNAQIDNGLIQFSRDMGGGMTSYSRSTSTTTHHTKIVSESVRATLPETSVHANQDEPSYGLELIYAYRVGSSNRVSWGVETGLSNNRLDISSKDLLALPIRVHTRRDERNRSQETQTTSLQITRERPGHQLDSYALNGVIPPLAPYKGSFAGPGPLISATPASSTIVGGQQESSSFSSTISNEPNHLSSRNFYHEVIAEVTGKRYFEADILTLRMGPYLDLRLHDRVHLALSAGGLLNLVLADYGYDEQISIPGVGSRSRSGHDSSSEVLFGGYIDGRIIIFVSESCGIYASLQSQFAEDFEASVGDKIIDVDFGSVHYVALGLIFGF